MFEVAVGPFGLKYNNFIRTRRGGADANAPESPWRLCCEVGIWDFHMLEMSKNGAPKMKTLPVVAVHRSVWIRTNPYWFRILGGPPGSQKNVPGTYGGLKTFWGPLKNSK